MLSAPEPPQDHTPLHPSSAVPSLLQDFLHLQLLSHTYGHMSSADNYRRQGVLLLIGTWARRAAGGGWPTDLCNPSASSAAPPLISFLAGGAGMGDWERIRGAKMAVFRKRVFSPPPGEHSHFFKSTEKHVEELCRHPLSSTHLISLTSRLTHWPQEGTGQYSRCWGGAWAEAAAGAAPR